MAMIAFRHSNANFKESVVWFMWTLEVLAVRYTGSNALRGTTKIQGVVDLRALVDAI